MQWGRSCKFRETKSLTEKVTLENSLDEREKGSHGMSGGEHSRQREKYSPPPPPSPLPPRAQWECAWEVGSWRPGCLWGRKRGDSRKKGGRRVNFPEAHLLEWGFLLKQRWLPSTLHPCVPTAEPEPQAD